MNFAEQILTHRFWKTYGFQRRQFGGVGGCAGVVGWKSYKIVLWWSLYNYKCNTLSNKKSIEHMKMYKFMYEEKFVSWFPRTDICGIVENSVTTSSVSSTENENNLNS